MLGKDYRVLDRIGTGGMAAVYLVEHQTLLKQFAAKVLAHDHAKSAEARARFTQEAHAASQLDHENIVSISDFGISSDARPYFVMELLRGKTLAERLDEGPMSLGEVVAVSVPVARALAHAHAEGIVHRDVKPENIFLVQRTQGRWSVKVLDFGIARVPVNDRMTKTGQALGSPMFMAPEACRGEEVDQRADIYSFGVVLFMMLTGRAPFEDENLLRVLQMQVSAPLPTPRSLNPDIPPAIEAVVVRALAKEPEDRYPTMDAFLFDLEAALPDGSDELLIQAQFGKSMTPFPGSLERVRTSQRMQRISASPFDATGQHSVSSSTFRGAALPPAPRSGRALGFMIATLLAGVAGAAGYYAWVQYSQKADDAPVTAANVATPVPPTPTPAPTPTAQPAPPEPSVVVAEPSATEDRAIEPSVEPAPAPTRDAAPTGAKAVQTNRSRPVRVATATVKPTAMKATTKEPTKTSAGSGSAVVVEAPSPIEVAKPKPVETPVAPTPPPAPTTPPVATPAPAPVAKPRAPQVDVGSLDATPSITRLDVDGSLPSSIVRRTVERALPSLRECYQAAAAAQRKTPPLSVSFTFEIDESRAARNVSATGAPFGSLTTCAKSALGRLQSQQAPDVGTVQVVVAIKFTPN